MGMLDKYIKMNNQLIFRSKSRTDNACQCSYIGVLIGGRIG